MVHWINEAQPTGVAKDATTTTEQSLVKLRTLLSEIDEELEKIVDDSGGGAIMDDGKLGRFIKMLSVHRVIMKYELNVDDRALFSSALMKIYMKCRLPISRKTGILEAIKQLLMKKFLTVPSFVLPWRELWTEALDLVNRAKSKTSEIPDSNSSLPMCIAELLHTCRAYIPLTEAESIVDMAMAKLEDVTQPACAEGLLLLINCLPTAYSGYDALLPRWLEIWDRLRHNMAWDACWATLFCRARKHCDLENPAWRSLSSLLEAKMRAFLSLPGTSNIGTHNPVHPFKFHSFYDALIPTNKSKTPHSQVAVMKATKIMYFFTLRECPSSDLVLVDPVPISKTLTPQALQLDQGDEEETIPGFNSTQKVRPATVEILALLQSIRPFVYPSNTGPWSPAIACLLAVLCSEMSRHIGRNLTRFVLDKNNSPDRDFADNYHAHAASVLKGHRVFEKSLHLGTIRFLFGTLTALNLEAVYSKSSTLQQLCTASLRNLVGLDPTLGKVVVPFLLQSLDPSAVSQSHQAPAAMSALGNLFKPLLFPCPLILEYLPTLLELSLPGVDPNDTKKSVVTLKLYEGILAALPIRASYATPTSAEYYPPAYLSLLLCDDPDTVGSTSTFMRTYSSYTSPNFTETALTSIASAFESWAPRLLERIFSLLDASEERKKGSQQGSTAPLIESVMHNLFVALQQGQTTLRTTLEDMLIDYFKGSNNINAAKACAKVAGQCTQSPGFLSKLVKALATPDLISQQCSNDRLVYRISVLGGATRGGPGEYLLPHMETWQALTSPSFLYHNEKSVRKASVKFVKDLLRGLSSYYPLLLSSNRGGSQEQAVLGVPVDRNYLVEGRVGVVEPIFRWYEPSIEALKAAVSIIRATAYAALRDIRLELQRTKERTSNGGDKESSESKKQAEEWITFRLKVVQKALRGAAEVLGDDVSALPVGSDNASISMSSDGYGVDEVEESEELEASAELGEEPLNDGLRVRAAACLRSSEDAAVLKGFRGDVMNLLLEVRAVLCIPKHTLPEEPQKESQGSSLSSSVAIHKAWAKLFTFLICRRASTNKNMEMAKSWQSMSTRMSRTMLCKTMRRQLQLVDPSISKPGSPPPPPLSMQGGLSTKEWKAALAHRSFWDGHGINSDDQVRRAIIQHIARLQQISFELTRRALRSPSSTCYYARKSLMACLGFLTDICCHEYDAVREAGNRAFTAVIPRFGVCIKTVIRRMFDQTLVSPSDVARTTAQIKQASTYGQVSGALKLLAIPYVVGRVTREWGLLSKFFDTMCRMPGCIAAVDTDTARKELMTLNIGMLFVRYIGKWAHIPVNKNKCTTSQDPANLLLAALARVGFAVEISESDSMEIVESETGARAGISLSTVANFSGGGLRFDAFNSFIAMGLLGHPDLQVPPQAWLWALQTSASAHGQPAQLIAWGALARLCALLAGGSSTTSNPIEARKLLQCTTDERGLWPDLLQGISAAHPKSSAEEGEAQWAGGVDGVLNASNIAISPHRTFSIAFENNVVSSHFLRESAVLFWNMWRVGFVNILDKESVNALLDTAKKHLGVGGSDAETRRNNVTHSELFGSLLRALADSAAGSTGDAEPARHSEVLDVLLKHYNASLDKLSLEYAKDWDEALLFALSGPPSDILVPFLKQLSNSFKLAIGVFNETDPEMDDSDATDEGFNRQGRRMVTAAVMLRAMVTSSWQAKSPGTLSKARQGLPMDMATSVVAAKAGVISSYRTSRSYMSGILRSLLVRGQHGGALPVDLLKGLYSTVVDLAEQSILTTNSASDNNDEGTTEKTTSSLTTTSTASAAARLPEEDIGKHALEVACAMLDNISADFPVLVGVNGTSEAQKLECEKCVVALARCAVRGCGHADPETASRSRQSATMFAECVSRGLSDAKSAENGGDTLGQFLRMLHDQQTHPSFRVRLVATECVMMIQMDKWPSLTAPERILAKEVFTAGFSDSVPEVVQQAQAGFSGYLSFKTPSELRKLSEAFCRNSDKYVAIEKQRKKSSSGTSEAPKTDVKFTNMVHMMCCIILAFPYDLPVFLPQLLACTVRHAGTPALKETISRTVLEFKRTHQDRWTEFKKLFSAEQLDSLSGATQVSYFS